MRASIHRLLGGLAVAVVLAAGCTAAPAAPPAPPAKAPSGAAAAPSATQAPPPTPSAPQAAPGAPATVRAGVLGIQGEAGIFIALERGYFQEEGLSPEFTQLDTGARAVPGLATGQLDMTAGAFSPSYVNAVLRGVGLKMVAGMLRMYPGDNDGGILVRKDLVDSGQVRDWPDLRGRTIAVPARGSVNDYALARGLQTGGLTLGDVELVELSFADMLPGLANGQIDAGSFAAEPLPTVASERGVAVRWRNVGDFVPGISPNVMSFAPGFAQNQPDVGRRWMVAYLRGTRDYAAARRGEGRADVIAILTKHTLVKDPALYERISWAQLDPDGALNLPNLVDQTTWYAEQGILQGRFDPASVVDTSYVDSALARLGPYRP